MNERQKVGAIDSTTHHCLNADGRDPHKQIDHFLLVVNKAIGVELLADGRVWRRSTPSRQDESRRTCLERQRREAVMKALSLDAGPLAVARGAGILA